MKGDRLGASVLAVKMIPNVDAKMAEKLGMPKGWKSLGILTADADDVTYCALDEACKNAEVSVVMGKSFYGGAANANSRLAGEVIGMLAGPSPAEVRSGLNVAIDFIENEFSFTVPTKTTVSLTLPSAFPEPVLSCPVRRVFVKVSPWPT
ncbi:BMC domain-containing protein [Endozoicomonas sp. GU-1]|uniref:BMC domain-containing protein n=1 Tax=Endozoicomonas sp. GU-1 TaxID=3009078 RepID=UPI0022B2C8B6|nr:BMC domain-containing protein [Endozoicomonas sp. GU-1]WBA81392.1 BMC domain-containing protein [Endozoicomonas sp. GU-1]